MAGVKVGEAPAERCGFKIALTCVGTAALRIRLSVALFVFHPVHGQISQLHVLLQPASGPA